MHNPHNVRHGTMRQSSIVNRLTFRSAEVQHVPIFPEHVHLLHARDRLHVQLLQRTLELFVVLCVRRFRFAHYLSPHCALPA